jgi:cytochrome c oxidase subunit 2
MQLIGELIPTFSRLLGATGYQSPLAMPESASTNSASVDPVYDFITWLCIFFFVLIVVVMGIFMVKYRRVEGRSAEVTATHNTPLELTWTIVPLILVIAIFYVGMKGYIDLRHPPENSYVVRVSAAKWTWTFSHDNGATMPSELLVPVNEPVKLVMTSQDLLHSLFIPAFRVKQDVVPGRFTYLWFEATKIGVYDLYCTEYCGTQHSMMIAKVHVVSREDFDRRIIDAANWIKPVPEDLLHVAGLKLYMLCKSCHSLDGKDGIGPSFQETHSLWGKSRVLRDGTNVTVDENYILNSIRNPQGQIIANKTGAMPLMPLKDKEVQAMIQFIRRLDEVVDAQGRPLPNLPALPAPGAAPAAETEAGNVALAE